MKTPKIRLGYFVQWHGPAYRPNSDVVDSGFFSEDNGYEPQEIAKVHALGVGQRTWLDDGRQLVRRLFVALVCSSFLWGCNPYKHFTGHTLRGPFADEFGIDADVDLYQRGNKVLLTIDGHPYSGLFGVTYLENGKHIEVWLPDLKGLDSTVVVPMYTPSNY